MTTPDSNPAQPSANPPEPILATPVPLEDAEYLFLRRTSAVSNVLLWTLGGLLAFGFAVIGGVIAFTTDVDEIALQAMTTLPILAGIGCMSAAWALGQTPSQVSVGPEGLAVEGRKGKKVYPWSEIGYASVSPTVMNSTRQLVVCNTAGKRIVKFTEAFSEFDLLVDMVNQRLAAKAAKGDDTVDRLRIRKAKRTAIFTASVAVVMLGATGGLAWMTHADQRAARLLAESAVPGEADVVDRHLAPNGRTCRLEYRVTTPEGLSGTRDAEVTRPYWDSLEGVKKVPVVYVSSEPEISRLAEGEVVEKHLMEQPLMAYGLCALMVCVCLFLLVGAALQWNGWDIDLDSKTGKISIKRFGTGR